MDFDFQPVLHGELLTLRPLRGEMKRLMLRHAFGFVDRVVFLVGPTNYRSQRAVEKIGGVRAGTRSDGSGRESVLYEIRADMFAPDIRRSRTESGSLPGKTAVREIRGS